MDTGWRINREISPANILAALGVFSAVLFAYADLRQLNAIQDVRIENNTINIQSTKNDIGQALQDLKMEIRELRKEIGKK